jgi:hypothetical protein
MRGRRWLRSVVVLMKINRNLTASLRRIEILGIKSIQVINGKRRSSTVSSVSSMLFSLLLNFVLDLNILQNSSCMRLIEDTSGIFKSSSRKTKIDEEDPKVFTEKKEIAKDKKQISLIKRTPGHESRP